MELGSRVTVTGDISVQGVRLKGMRGVIVDAPGPDARLENTLRFVRFPATPLRDEFFSWIRLAELQLHTAH